MFLEKAAIRPKLLELQEKDNALTSHLGPVISNKTYNPNGIKYVSL